jgi:hypothetical protein
VGYGPTLTRFHPGTIGCCILVMYVAKSNLTRCNRTSQAPPPVDPQPHCPFLLPNSLISFRHDIPRLRPSNCRELSRAEHPVFRRLL